MMRQITIIIALGWVWAAACAMPRPPLDAVMHQEGGTVYYSGTVYLSSHDDTTELKPLGFRAFEFECRTFGSLKYKAQWPESVADFPTPDFVNGMNYDLSSRPSVVLHHRQYLRCVLAVLPEGRTSFFLRSPEPLTLLNQRPPNAARLKVR